METAELDHVAKRSTDVSEPESPMPWKGNGHQRVSTIPIEALRERPSAQRPERHTKKAPNTPDSLEKLCDPLGALFA